MKLSSTGKRLVAIAILATVGAPAAFAIFGLGDIVYDPAAVANLIRQFHQMEQQYVQLLQTYQMVRNQYSHMIFMSKMVPSALRRRYRTPVTPWRNSFATDTYGTTGGWIAAINTGAAVRAGYEQAIQKMNTYESALSKIPAGQLDRVRTSYATVELTDGANQSGIDLLGRLRASAPQIDAAVQALENDSLSSDPNLNTEISVLNKINAANLIALRSTQDTNKLLVAVTEEQIIEAKRKRDAEAAAINSHVRFLAEEQALLRAQTGDPSARMRAYRMP